MEFGKLEDGMAQYCSGVTEQTAQEVERFYERVHSWTRGHGIELGEGSLSFRPNKSPSRFLIDIIMVAPVIRSDASPEEAQYVNLEQAAYEPNKN